MNLHGREGTRRIEGEREKKKERPRGRDMKICRIRDQE